MENKSKTSTNSLSDKSMNVPQSDAKMDMITSSSPNNVEKAMNSTLINDPNLSTTLKIPVSPIAHDTVVQKNSESNVKTVTETQNSPL